jgi:4-amino-4-deoxy-L-arabinose transferase-like glycosyltransferase
MAMAPERYVTRPGAGSRRRWTGWRFRAAAGAILALAACIALWRLGSYRIFSQHESVAAQAARGVRRAGPWTVLRAQSADTAPVDPLMPWLVAAAAAVGGRLNETLARLPSVLAGVGTVAATIWLGVMLAGRRIGLIAGLVAATSAGVVWHARTATPDMVGAFLCTLSLALLWRAWAIESAWRRRTVLVGAYVALAAAVYAQGWTPIIIVSTAVVLQAVLARAPSALLRLHVLMGAAIVAALTFPLAVPALLGDVGEAGGIAAGGAGNPGMGPAASGEPMPFYCQAPYLFVLLLPWAVFLPEAVVSPFLRRYRWRRWELMFPWLWAVAGMVTFAARPVARGGDLLLILPPLCVLLAVVVDRVFLDGRAGSRRRPILAVGAILAVLSGVCGVGMDFVSRNAPELRSAALAAMVLALGGVGAAGLLYVSRRRGVALLTVAGAAAAFYLVPLPAITCRTDGRGLVAAQVAAIREHVPVGASVFWLVPRDPRVVFYADRALPTLAGAGLLRPEVYDKETPIMAAARRATARVVDRELRDRSAVYLIMRYWQYKGLVAERHIPARIVARVAGYHRDPLDDPVVVTRSSEEAVPVSPWLPALRWYPTPATPTTRPAQAPRPVATVMGAAAP